jgi:hypothetical protein
LISVRGRGGFVILTEKGVELMATEAEEKANRCERCDEETERLIKFVGPDNAAHHICWSCLSREEKHVNLKGTWKRGGRAR